MIAGQLGGEDRVSYSQVSQFSRLPVQILLVLSLSTHGVLRLYLVWVNLGRRIREVLVVGL